MRAKKIYEEEFRFMKGPSKEKILKRIEKLSSIDEKFEAAVQRNIFWLVKDCLNDENFDTSKYRISIHKIKYDPQLDKIIKEFNGKKLEIVVAFMTTEMYDFLTKYIKTSPYAC